MKKKVTALVCALALSVSLLTPAAFAAPAGQGEVLQVLAAMGVMNGDEKGDLNLEDDVTRAAFTKMAVAASVYKDMATATAYVSPFADVKYDHWAAGYVKTGVDAGWINGYLDGTFRPNNPVKLEEAVNICLKMLGYTSADFTTGTFPHPQLALYQNLKMNTGISAVRGEELTRAECATLIYNTLNANTKTGAPYATTLGYGVDASGNIDYLSVVNAELEGPVIADGDWENKLGFTPAAVYRNDSESSAAAVQKNDVVYYLEKTKTVWVYRNAVTGVYEAAQPSRSNPTSVTVSGVNYAFETSSAAYAMSTTGQFKLGDTVTLLLGRDNTVAAVIDPAEAGSATFGIVLGTGTAGYTDAQGKPYTAPYVKLLGVDGVSYQYQTDKGGYYKEGDLVKVAFENGDVKLNRISNSASAKLSGTVNSAATRLGSETLAADVKIMDYADESAVTVPASRLAGVKIDSGDVAYYEKNGAGEIETLILKNVTGDVYSFGILTKDEEMMAMGMDGKPYVAGHIYTLMSGGAEVGPLVCQTVTFPVHQGKAVRYRMDGTALDKMYDLNEVKLLSAENGKAAGANNQKFNIASGVQVYEKKFGSGLGTKYYVTSLDKVNGGDYTLTGWYDQLDSAGGRMRVIIATAK